MEGTEEHAHENAAANRRDASDLQRDFDALMKRHQAAIYNLALQFTGDADDAGDILTETFVSAYKARNTFRNESKVYTWLYRIALNHSKNRLKSKSRQRAHEGPSLDAGYEKESGDESSGLLESSLAADWSHSPELLLQQGELRVKINEAIESLPQEYRIVLILREIEDMPYNDIAETTGLSLEAVKTRISRARGMVRRKVAPYYREDA